MPQHLSIRLSAMRQWLPRRDLAAHKGDFGHVLVVGGARGMTGAGVLAARGALRAGAGLVTLAVPESQQPVVASQLVEAITMGLPETPYGTLRAEAAGRLQGAHAERNYSVLALGPGISREPEAAKAVVAILDALKIPAIVDADALNVLAAEPEGEVRKLLRRRGAPCVFTPHPGEMARLSGRSMESVQSDRTAAARNLAREWGIVCLLKGRGTVVTDGTRTALNRTGNPGLAKGGSGDALTGIIAALWSQRLGAAPSGNDRGFESAVLGAYLHGLAADIAARDKTPYCLLASDVIEALPQAFRKLR